MLLRDFRRQSDPYAGLMDPTLHRDLADKLEKDAVHLKHALAEGKPDVALSIIKRVRRTSTMLVKALAATRDQRQP